MRTLNDLGLFILRLGIGVIMIVHGWDKLFVKGPTGVAGFFGSLDMPQPELFAWIATLTELFGGLALVIGLLTRLASLGIGLVIGGAIYYVHAANGFFNTDGGYEYQLLLCAASAALLFTGAGRWSLDQMLFGRNKKDTTVDSSSTTVTYSTQPQAQTTDIPATPTQ
ncbi:DoxX family protein [Corynebacterium mendelii]|uniref:DoxX family protein n=1 Tax=Corynebacterium mendelii TaxID=2765362 RepID=A0A939IWD3_9CORY|nr:DoxX family protein [Corynebacterium mendelii]MBN9645171.1 DoxX family protein [Corynebacterium mendelii]